MCRKCYRKTPQQRETGNVYQKLYLLRNPEKVENKRLWAKGYYQRPEVKEIKRVYYQLYNQKPEVKARDRVGGRNQNRIISTIKDTATALYKGNVTVVSFLKVNRLVHSSKSDTK